MNFTTNPNHVPPGENSSGTERKPQPSREDFTDQCWEILKRMLNGERLTMLSAVQSGIGDIRRRAKDLIEYHHIPVRREWIVMNNVKQKYKWYYIHPDDRPVIIKRLEKVLKDDMGNIN